jgi:mediator of RNA polymerase II transcription subunit 22
MFHNPSIFSEIVKLAKGDSEAQNSQQLFRITQCEQEHYEMHVRAANIARILITKKIT